jgi:molybdopterin/thiamine biosynthesis adenylyltransferase
MNVVTLDPKSKQDEQRKADMLEVLEEMKRMVESGEIEEFVACSTGKGECKIHASCLDGVGGVGLFEVGKHLLIQHEID